MSSPCRTSLALALLALAGCSRETRDFEGTPPGGARHPAAFSENSFQLAQGQRLFVWMNCGGCHSHGGGGMGPALMDEKWRYGASTAQIAATILQGRPNGMPSFRNRITDDQAWQLASYVRSLSAQQGKDVLAGRGDEPANIRPRTLEPARPIRRVTVDQDSESEQ